MTKKPNKQSRQLPTRGALNDLDKSLRNINDYSKVTPLSPAEASPTILQGLRKPKGP